MEVDKIGSYLDHFFSQTRAHHAQLSVMADIKANMLLTAASLVLTFSLRYLGEPILQWAVLTLIVFCFLTIIAAIYASMPKLPPRTARGQKPDLNSPSFNILFFGSFIDLEYKEYLAQMEKTINDPNQLFEAMCRELYSLGNFLAHKKYRYLRLAYVFFLTGLFSSGLVWAVLEALDAAGVHIWYIGLH